MESSTVSPSPSHAWLAAALIALAVVLIAFVPLFVCQPLWVDATHYDVLAQELLRGKLIYRDVTDTNFPGAIWIHAAVRSVVGWRTESLRGFDLGVVFVLALLLSRLAAKGGQGSWGLRVWGVVAMLVYYFSCTPMVHVQRDVWMLAAASLAVSLRWQRLATSPGIAGKLLLPTLEGMVWGVSVWIKPHMVLIAFVCWLVSLSFALRHKRLRAGEAIGDTLLLILGGAIIGGAGIYWLKASGSWPHFWDMMLNWSGEYRAKGNSYVRRVFFWIIWGMYYSPWSLLHAIAFFAAGKYIWDGFRPSLPNDQQATAMARVLLAGLYFSWLLLAGFLQLSHEYVLAVTVFPAIAVLLCWPPVVAPKLSMKAAMLAFALLALVLHPYLRANALAAWPLCWSEASSPRVKDLLSSRSPWLIQGEPQWDDLAKVEEFLRSKNVGDGELLCWDDSSIPLYVNLKVAPANRFIHAAVWLNFFRSRSSALIEEFSSSPAKYVVSDLLLGGFSPEIAKVEAGRDVAALPEHFPPELAQRYPWNLPVAFRAGRYVVFEVPAKKSPDGDSPQK